MRICSLVPAATEIIYALGLGDQLVGVSSECDYPPEAREKTVVVRGVLDGFTGSSADIDKAVAKASAERAPLYKVDAAAVRSLKPDVIVTQGACRVCAAGGPEDEAVLREAAPGAKILSLSPTDVESVFASFGLVGEATGAFLRSRTVVYNLRLRATGVQVKAARNRTRPRVVVLEWADPPYTAGHWIPEMAEIAGGEPLECAPGGRSERIDWDRVRAADPDVLVFAPCGYGAERAAADAQSAVRRFGLSDMRAVKEGRAFAVDANAYFTRPGPRLLDGIELLAHLFWGDGFPISIKNAWRRVTA